MVDIEYLYVRWEVEKRIDQEGLCEVFNDDENIIVRQTVGSGRNQEGLHIMFDDSDFL